MAVTRFSAEERACLLLVAANFVGPFPEQTDAALLCSVRSLSLQNGALFVLPVPLVLGLLV